MMWSGSETLLSLPIAKEEGKKDKKAIHKTAVMEDMNCIDKTPFKKKALLQKM
ncbi:hypothetical protein BPIT_32200 [Candidatus Brocadia pituitae]|nr:hypothetical protein BPIT_32200 [Candidatus Brocadia pituitae]